MSEFKLIPAVNASNSFPEVVNTAIAKSKPVQDELGVVKNSVNSLRDEVAVNYVSNNDAQKFATLDSLENVGGIKEVAEAPVLDKANGRIQEFFATKPFILSGETIAVDTPFVVMFSSSEQTWKIAVIGKDSGFRELGYVPPENTGAGTGYSAEVLKDKPYIYLSLSEPSVSAITSQGTFKDIKASLVGSAMMGGSAIGTLPNTLAVNDTTGGSYLKIASTSNITIGNAGTIEYVVSIESGIGGIATPTRFHANLETLVYNGFTGKAGPATYVVSNTSYPTSGQHHFAISWDGTNMYFYQDGALVATKPYAAGAINALVDGMIGTKIGGRIGGIALHQKTLLASRISAHHSALGL